MRDDLLDAYAAADWARAYIPTVEKEFNDWINAPAYLLIEEPHPEMGQKLFKLQINRRFPHVVSAAVGAIINSVRTSLDVLATSLAIRNGKVADRNVFFPVRNTHASFFDPGAVGERKKWFAPTDIQIIENLRPYAGGDDDLFTLHNFDIVRKHRRLISVMLLPAAAYIDAQAYREGLTFPSVWPGFKDGAVIAWTRIDAKNSQFHIPAEITFDEPGPLYGHPVIPALRRFCGLANSIIQRFE